LHGSNGLKKFAKETRTSKCQSQIAEQTLAFALLAIEYYFRWQDTMLSIRGEISDNYELLVLN